MSPAKKPMMIVQMIPIVLSSHFVGGPVATDFVIRRLPEWSQSRFLARLRGISAGNHAGCEQRNGHGSAYAAPEREDVWPSQIHARQDSSALIGRRCPVIILRPVGPRG